MGKHLTVFTDATVVKQASGSSVQSFLVQRHLDALNLSAGKVKHVDGVANVIADLLSQSPWCQYTHQGNEVSFSSSRIAAHEERGRIFPDPCRHSRVFLC